MAQDNKEKKPKKELTPIARRMEAYRQNAGYTQEELGPLVGITGKYYSKVINSGNPPKKLLKKLADFYNIPVERFYNDQQLNFSAPPPVNPVLRVSDTSLFDVDTSNLNPLKINEAYLLNLLRALPEEYTFEVIEHIQNLYRERNEKNVD